MARVMVVEDEMVVAHDIKQTLTAMGHVVAGSAATGAEAITRSIKARPDLILMDIRLRGAMDGIQAGTAIRKEIDVPMIFLTAFADLETVERAHLAEPFGYVLKPFAEHDLRIAIDLAIRKHGLERELKTRERWVVTTLRSIGDAVIATDVAGTITFVNKAAESLTGWTHELALGRPVDEVLKLGSAAGGGSVLLPIAEACRTRRTLALSADVILLTPHGQQLAVENSVAPIVDDSGDVMGAVVIFRDISQRKKMETQLAISERMAALGTMTAGLAHEMNNPLAFVVGNAELAWQELAALTATLDRAEPDPAIAAARAATANLRAMLADLRRGTERAVNLVRDLRLFSRSDKSSFAPIDLREAVETAVRITSSEVRHRATFVQRVDDVPTVLGNSIQLSQVIGNLLINAAQSIPEGASSDDHEIGLVLGTAPDGRALIEVHDTGSGIAPEIMSRIFEPFFTTKKIGVGTGLGLPICHGIIAAHGGEIGATTSPTGRGTVFRVFLPPTDVKRRDGPTQKSFAIPAVSGARILIVDDERAIVSMLARQLRGSHAVTAVYGGQAALERIVEGGQRFDLILCDLMMPSMTGIDLERALERTHPDQSARMAFMTGGAFTEQARAFLASRSGRWIEKPFTTAGLREFVNRRLTELKG